jgi:hypothetical protein
MFFEDKMNTSIKNVTKQIFTIRWKPNRDLIVLAISWILVVGSLSMSTFVIGQEVLGGMGYFFMYALIGATVCGVGIPLYWTVKVKQRPISDLGLTFKNWKLSLILQIILAFVINLPRLL